MRRRRTPRASRNAARTRAPADRLISRTPSRKWATAPGSLFAPSSVVRSWTVRSPNVTNSAGARNVSDVHGEREHGRGHGEQRRPDGGTDHDREVRDERVEGIRGSEVVLSDERRRDRHHRGHVRGAERSRRERQEGDEEDGTVCRRGHGERGHRDRPQECPTRSSPCGGRTDRQRRRRSVRGRRKGRVAALWPRQPIPRTPCGRRRRPRGPRCRASRRSGRSSSRGAGRGMARASTGSATTRSVSMVCPMAHEACHAVYRGGAAIRCIVFSEGNVRPSAATDRGGARWPRVARRPRAKKSRSKKYAPSKKGDQPDGGSHHKGGAPRRAAARRSGPHRRSQRQEGTHKRGDDPSIHAR